MKAHITHDGDLKITVDSEERKLLRQSKHEEPDKFDSDNFMHELFEGFIGNSEYDWVEPEHCGALTSAPLIGVYGEEIQVEKVWGFMDYQIVSVQEQLLQCGYAVFKSGNSGPAVDVQFMADDRMHVIIPTGQPGINSEIRGRNGDTPLRAIDAYADKGAISIRGISAKQGILVNGWVNFTAEAMDTLCILWQQWRQRQ